MHLPLKQAYIGSSPIPVAIFGVLMSIDYKKLYNNLRRDIIKVAIDDSIMSAYVLRSRLAGILNVNLHEESQKEKAKAMQNDTSGTSERKGR